MAMAIVARKFYESPDSKLNLIAVTGTSGKTTTAYLCRSMLGKIGRTAMLSTVEYDLGDVPEKAVNTTPVALTLFNLLDRATGNGCENAVLEASSHAIEGKRIYGTEIDAAIFTNLSPEHMDFHGNLANYFASKKKLFDGTNGHAPKLSVVNCDDAHGRMLHEFLRRSGFEAISFGVSEASDFRICGVAKNSVDGSIFEIRNGQKSYKFKSRLFGDYNLSNIAAGFAACMAIRGEPELFLEAIAEFEGVPGRLDEIILPNGARAFVDFAHKPDALERVIVALNSVKNGRLITVFGCGGDRDATKRAPMTKIANELSDFAIATSDNPRTESQDRIFDDMRIGIADGEKIKFIADRREAISLAISLAKPEDMVLVAGKGHEDHQLIGGKTFHFNDKELILELCSKEGSLRSEEW
jgi:UDP-N-acetylmuramoyl-L-alanyl-D-glutamate--2,6-diaminopimelate ligase